MCRCRSALALGGLSFVAMGDLQSPAELAGFIVALLVSLSFHESAHALVASALGDDTARHLGRVTLNPLPHIDPIGTLVLPILLYMTQSTVGLGWAKPVPVNPFRFRNPVVGMLLTAAAGPLSNLLLAFLFAVILGLAERAGDMTGNAGFLMLFRFVTLNLGLAIFNLLPVPPLDGSSVLAAAMTERARTAYLNIGGAGIFVILILQGTGMLRRILGPPIEFLFGLAMDVASFARG